MKYKGYDDHVVSVEQMSMGDPWAKEKAKFQQIYEAKKQLGDDISVQKNFGEWVLNLDVNEYGKLTLIARRSIGRLSISDSNAGITFTVETTDHRVPLIRIVGSDEYHPKFIEVDDRKSEITPEFKEQDEDYKHEFVASSVYKVDEFFNQIIPEYELILSNKELDQHISKLAEQSAMVEKPYTKNYVLEK
jgi:hypothetical protein